MQTASALPSPLRLIEAVRERRETRSGIHQVWRVRAATIGLWLLIGLAAIGGLRGLLASPAASRPSPAGVEVGGFAELYVAAYLEAGAGHDQALRQFYPRPTDLQGVTASSRYASRTAVVGAAQTSPGYWAVTVGADVLVTSQGGYVQAGTHYFRVGIFEGPTGMVATSLPAEIPAPSPGTLPHLGTPALSTPAGDAGTTVVRRFFDAYLTGHGDLGSVLSPGARIPTITPPPFASDELVGIAAGPAGPSGQRSLLAEVAGTDAGGLREVLDYTLQIVPHAGNWAIAAVLPDAPLSATQHR